MGVTKRSGCGKIRHLQTQYFWIQELVSSGRLSIYKVGGTVNPADLMTKYLSGDSIKGHLSRMHLVSSASRPANAPVLYGVGGLFRYVSGSGSSRCFRYGRSKFLAYNNNFLDSSFVL